MTGQSAASQLIAAGHLVKLFPTYDKMLPRDELTDAGKALVYNVFAGGVRPVYSVEPRRSCTRRRC
jgi:hypothetical protein